MKILHLIQKKQLRGAEMFTSQLASHTNQSGHKAIIVALFPGNAELPFNEEIIILGARSGRRFWDLKAWSKLARLIASENPDIIQANAGDTLKYAVFSKIFFGWKQPILFRNASTISLYIKSAIARKWNSIFFRHAARIVSVSKTSASDFARLFPQYKSKIITVPIGIEHTEFNDFTEPVLIKGTAEKKFNGPQLVHVGGFSFEKNHKGLISIFEKILKQIPNATLHLVGDGPLKKQVRDVVNARALSDKIIFHGFQKNALQYIREADALLLPSLIEGLPGVILEAFYCKTPVVAYGVGGIPEIVINAITGRLIIKNDETAFAEAVVNTVRDDVDNTRQIKNAHKLVMESYLNTQVTLQFLSLYKSVLSNGNL